MVYLNSSTGTLEPVPWDVGISPQKAPHPYIPPFGHHSPILDLFLRSFENYQKRNRLLWFYLKDDSLINETLSFYDQLWDKNKKAFAVSARDLGDDIYSGEAIADHTLSDIKNRIATQR